MAKSTTIDSSLFLVPAPYLSIIISSLCFLCPHVHLGLHLALSPSVLIHFLSIHPDLAKNYFSPPCCCQPNEHKHLLCLVSILFTCNFIAISLSDSLFTSKTLSNSSSLTTVFIPFFYHQLHCKIVCSPSNVPHFTFFPLCFL